MSKDSASEGDDSKSEELPAPAEAPNADTDEDQVFAEKAILFRFCSEKLEWITRGSGLLKVLKHRETGKYRILMRQNQTYVVRANHQIPYLGALRVCQGSNRQFTWTAFDFSGEEVVRELFAVRFGLPEIAAAFKSAFETGQAANKAILVQ
jgi:E3 SUMO-protein ligase RanBP2